MPSPEHATGRPGAEVQEIAPAQFDVAASSSSPKPAPPSTNPPCVETLETLKRETEQALGHLHARRVLSQGFDEAAKAKAAGLVQRIPRLPGATPDRDRRPADPIQPTFQTGA